MSLRALHGAVVVGGGVAGTSAALSLTRAGLSTCILERTDYSPWRPGETLSPETSAELRRLVGPRLLEGEGFLASHGLEATWGSDLPQQHFFLTNPYGCGWHVGRRHLDALLARHVEEHQVRVLRRTSLQRLEREGNLWRVTASGPAGVMELRCDVLVDATGRAAQVARLCGVRRSSQDDLCSVSAIVDRPVDHREQGLQLEATPVGWWYAAPLPADRLIVTLLSDRDVLARHDALRPAGWTALLSTTRHLAPRLGRLPAVERLHLRRCETSRLERAAGEGWAAVGDAAAMWDPLSSSGILKALRTGRSAAEALTGALGGEREALERYAQERDDEFTRYLSARQAHYSLEQRWMDEEFWWRRQREPSTRARLSGGGGPTLP